MVAVPNNSVVVSEAAPAELVPAAEGLAARHVITAFVFFDGLNKKNQKNTHTKQVAGCGGTAIGESQMSMWARASLK